tara:strand:- start:3193 stop:4452 length:1260 start_codon:yes stop_codon:yes gene_type:complete
MINRFSEYLVEEEKVGYLVFGRMNPPTIGHGKLLDKLAAVAGRAPYRIYLSQSNDKKDNPLTYSDKVKFARKMFPRHARSIIIDKKVITPFHALSAMYDAGFKKVIMIAGSDRVKEYDLRLNKYNGKKGNHGFYNFDGGVKIVSAGQRDPDGKGAEGASGTKQRGYAQSNDFTAFSQGLSKAISNPDAKKMFNAVRNGMGLKEEQEFKRHVQLKTVSETREAFVKGELFELGEQVIVKKTSEVGKITLIGSNYVIVETSDKTTRQWLDAVEKIVEEAKYDYGTDASVKYMKKTTPGQNESTPQDSDIKDREGSQPKAYHKGLKKATKVARDRHFKKHGKKADNDSSAYKPAPGDAKGKTKTSTWTKKFKKMYGEESDPTAADITKAKIDREKKSDAKRHDRMMDKARTLDTKVKNKATK